MNSQFSIGFVIALVIGIGVGAFWPKYGVGLSDTVLGHDADAQQVSLTHGPGSSGESRGMCKESGQAERGHRAVKNKSGSRGGCGGGCEGADQASTGQCAANNKSGRKGNGCGESRGQSCSGSKKHQAGREQSARDCKGQCDQSHGEVAHHHAGRGRSGHGNKGRRSTLLVADSGNGGCGKHGENNDRESPETCQQSEGQCNGSSTCSSGLAGTDSDTGQPQRACASEEQDATSANQHHQRGRQSVSQQHGPGPGLGLGFGMGRGWERDFAKTSAADDSSQPAASD